MDFLKSIGNKVKNGVDNLVNGNKPGTDTEEIMRDPKIVNKGADTDEEPIMPVQKGGMDDPNSAYWEAEYYKYKHLFLKETGR